MMRKMVLAAVAATMLHGGAATAAITFNFNNVTLSTLSTGGTTVGTLTGSFTTNDALTTLLDYNIVASATGSFAGFVYTPSSTAVTASILPSQLFQLDSMDGSSELRVSFSSGLSATGGTIWSPNSYEFERSGGARFLMGSVVAATAPEPASWAMMIAGFGAIGTAMRRRKVAVSFA